MSSQLDRWQGVPVLIYNAGESPGAADTARGATQEVSAPMPDNPNARPCACGCGQLTSGRIYSGSTEPSRFVHGHHRRGVVTSPETRQKLSLANKDMRPPVLRGPANPSWKGDRAGYSAIHIWRNRYRPRKRICELCRFEGDTEWHNISKTYPRYDDSDWQELCDSCHHKTQIRTHPCKTCGGSLDEWTPGCESCYQRHYKRRTTAK